MENSYNPSPALSEFVGTTVLDTIGLVIPAVDRSLKEQMKLPREISSLGLISSRTGAAGQICAVDEALKNTNARLISIDLPRDTKGWGGHGNYIVIGAEDVSDARRGVEISLELVKRNAGEVYINSAGHLEFAYSASAGEALCKAFDIPMGQAFGFMAGSPAAIGMVMADYAMKSSDIRLTRFMTPSIGTSHTNEVIIAFTGDASAAKNAVLEGRRIGLELISSMAEYPSGPSSPYLN